VAKKKTARSSEAPTATRTVTPKPAKQAAAKPSTTERAFSSVEMGNTAGEVWQALASGGAQSLSALKKQVAAPGDLVVAAVGWLAREGKLSFRPNGRTVVVELRDEN
jgi:hypothetical protein